MQRVLAVEHAGDPDPNPVGVPVLRKWQRQSGRRSSHREHSKDSDQFWAETGEIIYDFQYNHGDEHSIQFLFIYVQT